MTKNKAGTLAVLVVCALALALLGAGVAVSSIRNTQEYDTGHATLNGAVVYTLVGFWVIVGGVVGFLIGDTRGRHGLGFFLGALLGFIGWLAMMFIEPTPDVAAQRAQANIATLREAAAPSGPTRTCPWCAEDIKAAANLCRYCGRDVQPVAGSRQPAGPVDHA